MNERVYIMDKDNFFEDELGGMHGEGIGVNPKGHYCGECGSVSCKGCGQASKETKIDLSSVSTKDLHEELAKREGVTEVAVDVDEHYYITVTSGIRLEPINQQNGCGSARILINID